MLKKVLVMAAVLLFATAGTAGAQEYPPSGNGATVTITRAERGQPITIRVQVFAPGTTVDFTLFSAPVHLGSAVADANGVATLTFTVPESAEPGTHTIQATGIGADGQPLTVTETITVLGSGVGGSGLPTTGSASTTPMTQMAIAAIAGGGLLVLLANRRRSTTVDDRETAGV